jgi:hypothetical protein
MSTEHMCSGFDLWQAARVQAIASQLRAWQFVPVFWIETQPVCLKF